MEVLKKIQQFISYWYVRYLLATELYMVEAWEKMIVRILFKNTKTNIGMVGMQILFFRLCQQSSPHRGSWGYDILKYYRSIRYTLVLTLLCLKGFSLEPFQTFDPFLQPHYWVQRDLLDNQLFYTTSSFPTHQEWRWKPFHYEYYLSAKLWQLLSDKFKIMTQQYSNINILGK